MFAWIAALLLKAAVVLGVARIVPGVKIRGFGSAVSVAVTYGLLSFFLGWFLKIIAAPLIFLTLGLFLLVINAGLLWLTDKVVDSFEVKDGRSLFLATALMSGGFILVEYVVRHFLG